MINERQMLEAMLNSTPEQCRAAGELFLALADRPRDVHFKADLQRRLDALPPEASNSLAARMAVARSKAAERDAELWRVGWHPIQLLRELKRAEYEGSDGMQPPPAVERLLEMHDDVAETGLVGLADDISAHSPSSTD